MHSKCDQGASDRQTYRISFLSIRRVICNDDVIIVKLQLSFNYQILSCVVGLMEYFSLFSLNTAKKTADMVELS